MKKFTRDVPFGVEYMSEWERKSNEQFDLPVGEHCIINKGVTGCGFTEYCLRDESKHHIVLCSPRKLLLQNKAQQHKKDLNVKYIENLIETSVGSLPPISSQVYQHIYDCKEHGAYVKLMVTYDSLPYVINGIKDSEVLGISQKDFIFIVDEMQAVFLDSYFKADVEIDFVEVLQSCSNVIYLSAAPMLDKYLERIDEFKDLNYYKLNWETSGYTEKARIQRKKVASLGKECTRIIQTEYLSGNFVTIINPDKTIVESKEAVFYFNSVTDIIRVVTGNGLTPENTRIICADNKVNRKKLKRIGFTISQVPEKGEVNPMFLFCTSSTYIGVDMYSDCARTFVFADPNIKCLALDISLDLPQIMGRQRNKTNPWKNEAVVMYKTLRKGDVFSKEAFDEAQKNRMLSTNCLLDNYYSSQENKILQTALIRKFRSDIVVEQYSGDFISISRVTGQPVYNNLIYVANERAWDVAQKDYQDMIQVTRAISNAGFDVVDSSLSPEVQEFINAFGVLRTFEEGVRLYAEFIESHPWCVREVNQKIPHELVSYYNLLGLKGIKAANYKEANMKRVLEDHKKQELLKEEILKEFHVGDKFVMKGTKEKLKDIYDRVGINRAAKITNLNEYFKVIRTNITTPEGIVAGIRLEEKD